MTIKKKIILGAATIIFLTCTAWVIANPFRGFGLSSYAFTTYNLIPIPIVDFQVKSNGSMRFVGKSHDLALDRINWLLQDEPEIVIICIGWSSVVQPRNEIRELKGYEIHILPTKEALQLYNRKKKMGKKVAIHVHSTC